VTGRTLESLAVILIVNAVPAVCGVVMVSKVKWSAGLDMVTSNDPLVFDLPLPVVVMVTPVCALVTVTVTCPVHWPPVNCIEFGVMVPFETVSVFVPA